MKFSWLLAILSLYVVYVHAVPYVKEGKCRGEPIVRQVCHNHVDHGHATFRWCKSRAMQNMWYFNRLHKECQKMDYFGCGGNGNRYCTKSQCMDQCRNA
ncbi:kunitz-type kappaPI-theraphotoxin-Hs1a-like [Drosophila nasuta]|uniref:kunitz-type kappaPI-theraphotoxin-Hs1a-like n=1 Tax=Drosophila nasuta TaxID=42062 RepID=UPI00295E39E4|nr:kunitz-type kappaPI-theraphotoxin-Hs1a-like [Drosophila nasuta]